MYEYIDKTNKITDEDIISDLLYVKNDVLKKDTIKSREYFTYGKFKKSAIRNHFGTWNELLDRLNIPRVKTVEHLSKEEIFCLIRDLWDELQRQPNLRDFENRTKHTKKIIVSKSGKWSNCLQEFVKWANNENFTVTMGCEPIKHKTKRDPSVSLRYEVFTRDNYRCVICGRSTSDGIKLHIDHIKPYSLGGETVLENLRTLCDDCNLGKSNEEG